MNKLPIPNTCVMADEFIYQNVCKLCPSEEICFTTCDEAAVATKRIESALSELLPTVVNKPYPDEG